MLVSTFPVTRLRRLRRTDALRGLVTVEQAQQRWAALSRFGRAHGHFVITNGPYQLGKWSGDAIVLPVFRDFSYPLGVGTYDRHAWPLRAWATRVAVRSRPKVLFSASLK